jgi:hypothetical protein
MHEFRLKVTPTVSNPNLGLAPTPSYTNVMWLQNNTNYVWNTCENNQH